MTLRQLFRFPFQIPQQRTNVVNCYFLQYLSFGWFWGLLWLIQKWWHCPLQLIKKWWCCPLRLIQKWWHCPLKSNPNLFLMIYFICNLFNRMGSTYPYLLRYDLSYLKNKIFNNFLKNEKRKRKKKALLKDATCSPRTTPIWT